MKNLCANVLLFILSLTGSFMSANSQTLKQLDEVEKIDKQADNIKKAMKAADDLLYLSEKNGREFNIACMKATGYKTFCTCVQENRPWIFSFSDYVAITVNSRETNQYAAMDKETQKAYDKVAVVRDLCVAKSNVR